MCRNCKCIEEGCNIQPSFNFIGEKSKYCFKHKKEGMVNVRNRKCAFEGCDTTPFFNFQGEKKGLYCTIHKKAGMINVINIPCAFDGCNTIPIYNVPGQKCGIYCFDHKQPNMVNVKDPKCAIDGCDTIPNYNSPDKKRGLYCIIHKQDGMIDVRNRKCAFDGCNTIPIYNFPDQKCGIYCLVHKQPNMVNVKDPKCAIDGCDTIPNYNSPGEKKGLCCVVHKKEGMINVVSPTCKSHLCDTRVNGEKYDGYCLRCFIYTFPDKPVSRNYKTKEYAVKEFINTNFSDYDWVHDKQVQDGCSKRKPDHCLDLGDQVLMVETDENQHVDYDCSCENKRTAQLWQDVGLRPIVFIRFNPDDYITPSENVTSCWTINSKGLSVIKKSKQTEWKTRLNTLKETIQYWIENRTTKSIETVQLYYDTN